MTGCFVAKGQPLTFTTMQPEPPRIGSKPNCKGG